VRSVFVGVAFLVALISGAPAVFAQNPYGVGGYLDRPDVPDDDEYAAPQNNTEAQRRQQRRPRPAAPAEQGQSSQQGAQQPSSQETTGTTQGGQQRRQAAPASGQGESATQQQRRATGQGLNNQPYGYPTSSDQRPPASAQQYRPAAAAPKPARGPDEEAARREVSDVPIPPIPLRRPKFANLPERPIVTAIATPAPTAVEAPRQETPVAPVEPARTEAVLAPAVPETPPVTMQAVSPEPAPAPAPESVRESATPPAEAPSVQPEQTASPAPAPVENVPAPEAAPQVADVAPPVQEAAAPPAPEPEPAPSAPPAQEQAAVEPPAAPPVPETPAAPPPAMMAAATEVHPTPAETAEAAGNEKPAAVAETPKAVEPAPAPVEPAPAPVEKPAVAEQASPAPQPQKTAEASMPRETAANSAVPSQPQAETAGANTPSEPPAPAPVAPVRAMSVTIDEPQPSVPAVAPAMQDITPALPVRQTRVANAGDAMSPVPQPSPRQAIPLDRIIGQMLVVGFRGLTPEESWPQKLSVQLKTGTIGGVLFMSHNVQSPQQLKALTGFLQKSKGDIPALFAVDQEGGIVQRLSAEKGFQTYPTAGKIGQSNDPLTAYSVYRRLAAELSQNGFNLNLGPVVDLLRNDASPIIAGKERSFGSQPKHVAAFAKAFCIAHQDEGVLTVLKHFPGHGSTPFDTHVQPVDVGQSWTEDEIVPYRELISSRTAQAVMAGHIANPAMADEPGLPASLSAKAIRQVLRGDLGFTGVVISDDLEMGAIRARYSIEDSAVKAIKAGNDIVILSNQNAPNPDLPERVAAAIRKAVDAGELRREELQASYDRILTFKQRLPSPAAATASSGGNGKPAGAKRAGAERGGKAASAR
jgi:beta-N-acetylhexosaminidase